MLQRPYGKPDPSEHIQPIGLVGSAFEERLGQDGGKYRVLLEEQPVVSTKKPYEGTLTQHELGWLMSLPGVEYNLGFRFTVTPLDGPAEQALAALTA